MAALVERGEVAVSLIAKMAELPRFDQHTLKDVDEIVRVLRDDSPASPLMGFDVTGITLAALSLAQSGSQALQAKDPSRDKRII